MSDLISRKAAIDALLSEGRNVGCRYPAERIIVESDAIEVISMLPSAKPEIIHCGECAFAEVADPEDVQDGYRCRFHPGFIWFSGSFCSWAKAKTEVTE